MASLQGQQIDQTYEGLIKTADNTSTPPFPPLPLQYGDGTDTPISLGDGTSVGVGQITLIQGTPGVAGGGTLEVNGVGVNIQKLGSIDNGGATGVIWNGTYNFGQGFPGAPATTVDFTNATVTGLPSAAGLVSNGANGMKSDASLTTNPALSTGTNSVVLGDNARDEGNDNAISIGLNARVREPGAICIGANTEAFSDSVAIGNGAYAVYPGVSIGENARNFGSGNAVVIGKDTNTNYASNVVNIGGNTTLGSDNDDNIVVGSTVNVADGVSQRNIYIGNDIGSTTNGVNDNVIIGHGATTNTGTGVTIVGSGASATADGAVALGKDVVAATADTVSVKALETQTDSTPTAGGIIISDAGSTDRRINITSAGIPQIDSDPMLVNNSATNTAMTQVWSGTEAQYNALGAYDANTLYYLT